MGILRSANRISVLCCLFFAWLVSPVLAQPVLDFQPIPPGPGSRTTAGIVNGNRIEVLPGNIVQLDMFISGWDGVLYTTIGFLDVRIDGDSYCNGYGAPLNPLGFPSIPITTCSAANSCLQGGTCYDGAYISENKCTVGSMIDASGAHCSGPADCPDEFCAQNPDFLSPLFRALTGVNNRKLNYVYTFALRDLNYISGPVSEKYIGTLLVEIPSNAKGLYVFTPLQNGYTFWGESIESNIRFPFSIISTAEILVVEANNDADGDGVIDS